MCALLIFVRADFRFPRLKWPLPLSLGAPLVGVFFFAPPPSFHSFSFVFLDQFNTPSFVSIFHSITFHSISLILFSNIVMTLTYTPVDDIPQVNTTNKQTWGHIHMKADKTVCIHTHVRS